MDKEKNNEPSKIRFFAILTVFYLFVTVIVFVLNCLGFVKTSTSITLFAAIVGPSVPAFLALYLSRYSEQALISRKQALLLSIRIRKEISEERRKHFENLANKLENIINYLKPISPRVTPSNPLKIAELLNGNMKEIIQDDSVKNHLNKSTTGLDLERLPTLSDDIKKFNLDIQNFEKQILDKTGMLLIDKNSFTLIDSAVAVKNKTSISKFSLTLTLANIWMDLQKNNNLTNCDYIQEYFPKRPDPSHLENKSEGDWTIETPSLKFRGQLILTYTDNLYFNYDVLDIIEKLVVDVSLLEKFKSLYRRKEEIDDYENKAQEIIEKIKEQITSGEYKKIFDCCPYHEELI